MLFADQRCQARLDKASQRFPFGVGGEGRLCFRLRHKHAEYACRLKHCRSRVKVKRCRGAARIMQHIT